MAKLYFNYGAMSSGKTVDLIETAYKYNSKGNLALVMKPMIDTKGGNKIVSRLGLERDADIVLKKEESVFDYLDMILKSYCLIVDEAQFLSESQVTDLFIITKKYDIPVICYGLKTDFQSFCFEGSKRLLELSDELNEMVSICECGKKARFNARKINGEYVIEGESIFIGGDESYNPLCGECYFKNVLEKSKK